jgi:putative transposase
MQTRKQLRLQNYDYSSEGMYLVTLVTKDRKYLFGDVVDGKMQLNNYGEIVNQCWRWLSEQYVYVRLDEYVVMPNHFHGIIEMTDRGRRGRLRTTLFERRTRNESTCGG